VRRLYSQPLELHELGSGELHVSLRSLVDEDFSVQVDELVHDDIADDVVV